MPSTSPQPPRSPHSVLAEAEVQWIFSEGELAQSPSILDGMLPEKEKELRFKGVNFIMQVGIMLKLPQVTLTTGGVFFNRFLMRHSLVDKPPVKALHHYQIAATALFLATKVEENCRKMRELVVACCRVAQKNPNLIIDEQSKDYWRWRDTVLLNEDVLLEALCFDLTVESPHKLLFEMLKRYGIEHNKKLRNSAWAFVNDSNLTTLCLLFTSKTIAAAALYCAAKHCEDVAFPDEQGRPWWDVQKVKGDDIQSACNHMADIYENSPSRQAGEPSIYVRLRSPVGGDDWGSRTRLRREQTPHSPVGAGVVSWEDSVEIGSDHGARDRATAEAEIRMEERRKVIGEPEQYARENGHLSRPRDNYMPEMAAERSPKRLKVVADEAQRQTSTEPRKEELSEEGELEE